MSTCGASAKAKSSLMHNSSSMNVISIDDITDFITIKINLKHLKDILNPYVVVQLKEDDEQYVIREMPIDSYIKIFTHSKFKEWVKLKYEHLGVNSIASLRFMHDNIIHGSHGWFVGIDLNCKLRINNKIINEELMLLDISMNYMNGFRINRLMKMINFYGKHHHLNLPKLDSTV